jgi:hypothetical protein
MRVNNQAVLTLRQGRGKQRANVRRVIPALSSQKYIDATAYRCSPPNRFKADQYRRRAQAAVVHPAAADDIILEPAQAGLDVGRIRAVTQRRKGDP